MRIPASRCSRARRHALVLGGGIAGLLVARVLADAYEQVTIVERDAVPEDPAHRAGVPQSRHVHGLLARGTQAIEQLFPGLRDELAAAGAVGGDVVADVTWCPGGRRLLNVPSGLPVISASRPLIEAAVRKRVTALANVAWQTRTVVLELVADSGRVRGARVRPRGGEPFVIEADLVVDASGRASRMPEWLETLGYSPPAEERLEVGVSYATCAYRVPPHVMRGRVAVVLSRTARCPRGAIAQRIEGDRVLVSFTGYRGHEPPADHAGLLAHAQRLEFSDVAEIVENGEPLERPARYHVAANVRRRYEALRRFPEGLLVVGDAVCAFNPVYAQGMTVAAVEAVALGKCLLDAEEDLARRFSSACASIVEPAWRMAVANDLEMPGVGERGRISRAISFWMRQLLRAAEHDPWLSLAFVRVANLVDPFERMCSWRAVFRVVMRLCLGSRPATRARRAAVLRPVRRAPGH